jgi:hypothetical protein
MPDETTPPEPTQEPTVRELLVAEVDATCRRITLELDRLNRITDQLAPDRSRSCQVAIAPTRGSCTGCFACTANAARRGKVGRRIARRVYGRATGRLARRWFR